jgi:hypothetical protein
MTFNKQSSSLNHRHNERPVRLLIRDDDVKRPPYGKRHNLFVRLSSEVAWDLQNQILSSVPDVTAEFDDDVCSIRVDDKGAFLSPSVDFLPLQVTLHDREDGGTIYASFNGGTIHCDDNVGTSFFESWKFVVAVVVNDRFSLENNPT